MGRGLLTYYDVLKIARDSDARAIRSAYLALIRQFHPDNCRENPDYGHYHSSRINEAYRILGDPVTRSNYDAALARFRSNKLALFRIIAWERSRTAGAGLLRAGRRGARAPLDWLRRDRVARDRPARQERVASTQPGVGPRLQFGLARMAAAGRARLAEAGTAGRALRDRTANATGRLQQSIGTAMPAPSSGASVALMIAPLLAAAFFLTISYPTVFALRPPKAPQLVAETMASDVQVQARHAEAAPIRPASSTNAPGREAVRVARDTVPIPAPAIARSGALQLPATAAPSAPQAQQQPAAPLVVAARPVAEIPAEIARPVQPPAPAAETPAPSRRPAVSPQRACFDRIVEGPEAYRACVRAQSDGN